jgi:hypothetical protein
MKGTGASCTTEGVMDDMIFSGVKACSAVSDKPPFSARRTYAASDAL